MQIVAVCSTEAVTLTGLQVSVRLPKVQKALGFGLQTFWQRLLWVGFVDFFAGLCVCASSTVTLFFFFLIFFLMFRNCQKNNSK